MRLLERIEEIYAIGDRVGYSPEEDRAHDLAAGWMREAGLDVEADAAGNLIGTRGNARVWTGSHLDSVPNGGRYDGVLGVLAGIEAAERIDAPVGVVAFRDEERGFGGSLGLVRRPDVYVEVHIEQGPVLLRREEPLGVVSAIVGLARGEIVLDGVAGHAGTTPMEGRHDALVDAAELVLRARDAALSIPGTVATVGEIVVAPGAANVIPERATVSVDVRAPDRERLDALVAAIGFEPQMVAEPVAMDEEVRAVLREELERRDLAAPELVSGAGHDAGVLTAAGVRCGMLFVRSGAGGISHSPDEHSDPEDIALAVDVLAAALSRLAE
ncbi:MAG TPA: M20/M25/M40 family metallo-hydrolase [Gaiellaceae bacterium]|nr:M20/M25/M40 family metallo-hydrolase [Gaiellaceae bacterium]